MRSVGSSFEERREELGERLRLLREQAGLTGKELALACGWSAVSKVSKIERGRQTATQEDLAAWLEAVSLDEASRAGFVEDLAALQEEYLSWRNQVRSGHLIRQEEPIDRDRRAHRILAMELNVIPGLVQTADYARQVLQTSLELHGGPDDIEEAVRARMRRQQVLYEPGKRIEILIAESALVHPVASRDVMAGQLHRLVAAIGTPDLRLGLLPLNRRLPLVPLHGFWIVDETAMVETVTGELKITDPDELALYVRVWERLWLIAVEGEHARQILNRHVEDLFVLAAAESAEL
ncbi:DNA binding protein with helix-turn-helix domain [Actinoalloteichus hymeniacidonis]|uniref:DNA binding protein with helix-turn-helix domain n=1 Tax=Actinoalloteichus hymeniacidonis TaxID=340345 RepID=A0AAC9HW26_9PSEU|nr:DNA binding protein with helix-turn-helix domain [Actinoalloteichus hymeniacidonis]